MAKLQFASTSIQYHDINALQRRSFMRFVPHGFDSVKI
jgi:hypothetical protein